MNQSNAARANIDAYFRSRKPPEPMEVKKGDKVCYTRYFLKQIGVEPTNPLWRLEGEVVEDQGRFARVKWPDRTILVNTANLAPLGANLRRCE